jgi:hypothetical protein
MDVHSPKNGIFIGINPYQNGKPNVPRQYEKFEPPRIVAVPRDASNGEVFKQLKERWAKLGGMRSWISPSWFTYPLW